MSRPADGGSRLRWTESADLWLFAEVAERCYAAHLACETVSVKRELEAVAARGVHFEHWDFAPRAAYEAALAAPAPGTALLEARRAGKLRRRVTLNLTRQYGPLRDAFYRVVARIRAERAFREDCLSAISAHIRADAWNHPRSKDILNFMLKRQDKTPE